MDSKTFFIDILTLFDETYAGIANVNYQIVKYFYHNHKEHTYFFCHDKVVKKEIINHLLFKKSGAGLRDINESNIYENTLETILEKIRTKTVGIFQHVKSLRNFFDYEVQVIYDLTSLLTPEFHHRDTLKWHVPCIEKDLESNDLCVCISYSTREDLINYLGVPKEKTLVSYLGCEQELDKNKVYRNIFKKYKGKVEKFILILGTIEPRKNIRMIFNFIERNPDILDEYKFIFIGRDAGKDNWGETFEERISRLKINEDKKENCIRHFNYLGEEEKNSLLATAEFLIYPSIYEGFGLPVLEALALGCPVLASMSSSIPEVGEDSIYYFDPYSLSSFENSFYKLTEDLKTKRDKIVEDCIKQAAKFSWDNFNGKIMSRINYDLKDVSNIKVEDSSVFFNADRKFQILLIKLDHRGDFLLAIPAIMRLKDKIKNSEVDIIVGEWNVQIAKKLGVFRNIYVYNFFSSRSIDLPEEKIKEEKELIDKLPKYDIAVDLRRPTDTRFLLMNVPATMKVGYRTFTDYDKGIDICLDAEIDKKGQIIKDNVLHVSLQMLRLIDSIPINTVILPKITEHKPEGKQIGIFPGAGVDSRQWPIEYFVKIAQDVISKKLTENVNVYLAEVEKELSKYFIDITNIKVFVGLKLDEMIESLAKNRLVLANNSFGAHICSYLGVPVVAVYSGVETVWEWGPPFGSSTIIYSNLPCLPCHDIAENCPHDLLCLKQITPEYVLKTIEEILNKEINFSKTTCYTYSDSIMNMERQEAIKNSPRSVNTKRTYLSRTQGSINRFISFGLSHKEKIKRIPVLGTMLKKIYRKIGRNTTVTF